MKHYLIIVLLAVLATSPVVFQQESEAREIVVAQNAGYNAECREYLKRYVAVDDVRTGWVRDSESGQAMNVASGRVLNKGKKAVIVLEARLALLDANGRVLEERGLLDYPNGTPWQPRIEPGYAVMFYELLPPTRGVAPEAWTGEVRVTVTAIQMP